MVSRPFRWYALPAVPGDDDLDDLIDSYVADAMRATGLPADRRSKPPTQAPAPPLEPASEPAPIVPAAASPRVKEPTPTGVALLAAALFDDVSSQVSISAPLHAHELNDAVAPPPQPVGPSITFTKPSSPRPTSPPPFQDVPASAELYLMPIVPPPPVESSVPDTLPGVGPPPASSRAVEAFGSDVPTDPDVAPALVDHDDEPTNVVTRPT